MKVKICGLSTAEQVQTSIKYGADFCGFILNYPKSHRFIKFEKAKESIMNLPQKPGNETLLELYALNKQATIGDINIEKPAMFDFVANAKYNSWSEKTGMSQDDAKQKYIDLVKNLA